MARLRAQRWAELFTLNIIVHDGTVELWGLIDSLAQKKALRVAAEEIAGVRSVNNHLIVRPRVLID